MTSWKKCSVFGILYKRLWFCTTITTTSTVTTTTITTTTTISTGNYKLQLYDPRTGGFMPSSPGLGMHVEIRDPDDKVLLSRVSVCVCVCVCVCLPSCSIQGLSYARVVLSPYLYLSSFSFSWCTLFAIISSSSSPFQVSILLWEKLYYFVSFKQIPFCNVFLCPFKFLASHFLLNVRSFLSVSSRLLINSYIIIKSPVSLSFSVVSCFSLLSFLMCCVFQI